jgi:hypothetical protein
MSEKKLICEICGKKLNQEESNVIDDEDRVLCDYCYAHDTESAAITYPNEKVKYIGDYRNDTDGDFTLKYNRLDGWRGYYTFECHNGWVQLHIGELISEHHSQQLMSAIVEDFTELLKAHKIQYATGIAVTSNVFCSNGYFFVKANDFPLAHLLLAQVKTENGYDDPKWRKGILFPEDVGDRLRALFAKVGIDAKDDGDILKALQEDLSVVDRVMGVK